MPIQENFPIKKEEAKSYPPIPENVYQVELLDINVEDKPKYKQPNELEKVLNFQFVILSGKDKDGSDLRGRNIWRNFVPTYLYIGKNGKNLLYQIIEAFLGRELTQEEEMTMETSKLNKLIGRQCRVLTKNTRKDDKVYSNVDSFLVAENDLEPLSEEEKQNATVKKDGEEKTEVPAEDEVQVDNIPF